jgi:hypothetical protein
MTRRSLRRILSLAAGALAIAVLPQTDVIYAQVGKSTAAYKAPRTPWGDPDFQGNYTNLYEAGTPLERPEQFAGKKLSEITTGELKAFKKEIQDTTIQRFETPFDAPGNWWQDAFRLGSSAQAWLITDPEDGKVPPLTPEGQQHVAALQRARQANGRGPADSYEDRSLYDRCITRGFPTSGMPTIYGNSSRIVQGPGYVAIQYEMIHETRIIPVDREPRAHPGKAIRLDMGDARGHWEGDTLVVETTNFRPRTAFRNANEDTLRFVERYTRTAPDKLRWTVTVEDPKTWTKPWTFSMPLTMSDAEPIQLYECHEGNYGLRNILSAARAEEKSGSN